MLRKYFIVLFAIIFTLVTVVFGETITFTFANWEIDGGDFVFDVVAAAGSSDTTRIGDTLVYINYSAEGFGTNIVGGGKITVTKEELMSGDTGSPLYLPFYTITNITDHAINRVAITNGYNFPGTPTLGNLLTQAGKKLINVRIEILDTGKSSDLQFSEGLMEGQQYKSYNTNETKYTDVTASHTMDESLPVSMTMISATADKEIGVEIFWTTASEVNCAGFRVWKSTDEGGPYVKISTALIPSQENTSVAQQYSYIDRNVEDGIVYWYKVEELSLNGNSEWFGPISVQGVRPIPTEYDLAQNYPNPFNPETTIKYDLPENSEVTIVVYSLLGQEVKTLVKEDMKAGYHEVKWYGKNNNGVQVPSGMYIVQMQTENFRQTRKMTILR